MKPLSTTPIPTFHPKESHETIDFLGSLVSDDSHDTLSLGDWIGIEGLLHEFGHFSNEPSLS
jgi:hypothetical protein